MNLLFNSDIVTLLLKTNGGEVESLILLFYCMERLNCWWIDGGGVKQKFLFSVG